MKLRFLLATVFVAGCYVQGDAQVAAPAPAPAVVEVDVAPPPPQQEVIVERPGFVVGSAGTGTATTAAGYGTPATSSARATAIAGSPGTTACVTYGSKVTGCDSGRGRGMARRRGVRCRRGHADAHDDRADRRAGHGRERLGQLRAAVRAVPRRRPARRRRRPRAVAPFAHVPRQRQHHVPRAVDRVRPTGHVDAGVRQAARRPAQRPGDPRAGRVHPRWRAGARRPAGPGRGRRHARRGDLPARVPDLPRRHRRARRGAAARQPALPRAGERRVHGVRDRARPARDEDGGVGREAVGAGHRRRRRVRPQLLRQGQHRRRFAAGADRHRAAGAQPERQVADLQAQERPLRRRRPGQGGARRQAARDRPASTRGCCRSGGASTSPARCRSRTTT